VFVIFRSCSLSSLRVHIHSSSTLFVGAVNLAKKKVVGNSGRWRTGREGFTYRGTLHGYISRSASLSSDLCHRRTRILVVESASLLSNPRHCCRIRVVVVESASLLSNPCRCCRIHTMVVIPYLRAIIYITASKRSFSPSLVICGGWCVLRTSQKDQAKR